MSKWPLAKYNFSFHKCILKVVIMSENIRFNTLSNNDIFYPKWEHSFCAHTALVYTISSHVVYLSIQNYLVIKLYVKDEQIFFDHFHLLKIPTRHIERLWWHCTLAQW